LHKTPSIFRVDDLTALFYM